MKQVQKLRILMITMLVLAGAGAKASVIAWGPATTIGSSGGDGQGDVITNGHLVVAYNVGNPNVGTATINGVPFTYSNGAGAGLSSVSDLPGGYGGLTLPLGNLSAGYRQMLYDWSYVGPGGSFR